MKAITGDVIVVVAAMGCILIGVFASEQDVLRACARHGEAKLLSGGTLVCSVQKETP